MLEIEFSKIDNNNYVVTSDTNTIDNYVVDIINNISIIDSKDFNESINDILYENIVSRLVSGVFIKKHSDTVDTTHHVLITLSINNKSYNITLGTFNKEDALGYVNGITEI